MDNYNIDKFTESLNSLNINLNNNQIEQFVRYYEILVEWNKVMNLTGITEFDEVITKHFIDSLAIVKAFDMSGIRTIIDVGTGAGFPGIPLKIAFPELRVTLLDSLNKRIKFLDEVISDLNLDGIKTIHGRAEDFSQKPEHREKYDLCVSRAVANLAVLSEYCMPYVKVDGYFVPYKSDKIDDELEKSEKAIKVLGGKIIDSVKIILPNTDIERLFVVINKKKTTAKKYPRKAGIPAKEPIK